MKSLMMTLMFAALVLSLTVTDGRAQQWQVLATFAGRPTMGSFAARFGGGDVSRLDFDGDGVAEMSFTLDGNGTDVYAEEIELVIISGADPNQKWTIPLPSGIIAILIGFMDFDGKAGSNGAVKEILLAEKVGRLYVNPIVLYNIDATQGTYDVRVPDQGSVLIGGWDVDNDGTSELIIADPIKKEVQVWGLR